MPTSLGTSRLRLSFFLLDFTGFVPFFVLDERSKRMMLCNCATCTRELRTQMSGRLLARRLRVVASRRCRRRRRCCRCHCCCCCLLPLDAIQKFAPSSVTSLPVPRCGLPLRDEGVFSLFHTLPDSAKAKRAPVDSDGQREEETPLNTKQMETYSA